jgi:hypothetical protein
VLGGADPGLNKKDSPDGSPPVLGGADPGLITVVVPEEVSGTPWRQLVWNQRFAFFLKARLLFSPNVAVMDMPLVPEEQELAIRRSSVEAESGRSVVLVPISAVHDGTIRAMSYARALESTHLEALYFAADPEAVPDVADQWWDSGVDVPLSFVEAPFRDLSPPLLEEVRRHTSRPDTVVTVVLPEFLVTRWWGHLLHGQTALFIKQLLLAEPNTVVVSVPYRLPPRSAGRLDLRHGSTQGRHPIAPGCQFPADA